MSTQWLLIGGPHHGEMIHIKGNPSRIVTYQMQPLRNEPHYCEYAGQHVVARLAVYQVGIFDATEEQLAEIPDLIRELWVAPVRRLIKEEIQSLENERLLKYHAANISQKGIPYSKK